MSYLRDSGITEENFPLFAKMKQESGTVLNFFRSQSLRSDVLEAEAVLFDRILNYGALTRKQKEYIAVAVSGENMSTYCVTLHSEFLGGMGITDSELDQLGIDHRSAGLPEAETALLDFAIKLTRHPEKMTVSDVEALRRSGFTDEQILDASLTTAVMNFANRISAALGAKPETKPREISRSAG